MTQLENVNEGIANPGQGLCLGADCPEDRDMIAIMKQWGYNASDINDSLEFNRNYGTDKLVNKTALNKTGNFCFSPTNCVNATKEALETKALFDRYW